MAEITCHKCEKQLEIPEHVNMNRFEGEIRCRKCGSWWHIKIVDSKVEKMKRLRVGRIEGDIPITLIREAVKKDATE